MPGTKQDAAGAGGQPGDQCPVQDAQPEDSAQGTSKGAQDTAGGAASARGGAMKGVGALGAGLASTAGSLYRGVTAGVQDKGSAGKDSAPNEADSAGDAVNETTGKTKETLHSALDGATARGEQAPRAREAAKDTASKGLEAAGDYDTAKRKTATEAGHSASDAVGEAAGDTAGHKARSAVDAAERLDEKRQKVTSKVGQKALKAAGGEGHSERHPS
ncbi:MAG: hypothetical protein LQ346_005820 [Caloplaca aetnensis]|nr:MAG: hypothetical protein LQ346_005820 [Caloplaca aetnensis]